VALDEDVRTLATGRNFAAMTTLFEDGTPQTQVMWVDADETHLIINTEVHRQKFRNVERDPRVTLVVIDHENPYRYVEVRGHVDDVVRGQEARDHIDACSRRYFGRDYPADNISSERVILRIAPGRVLKRGF
jgi:PPOX class probable F420-dependent enzyme